MRRLLLCTIAAIFLATLGACSVWNDKVVIPTAEQVADIRFSARAVKRTIKDREKIDEILSVLNQLNHGWRTPFTTMPTPEGFLDLNLRGGEKKISFMLGVSWLSSEDRIADADTEKMQELMRLLKGR